LFCVITNVKIASGNSEVLICVTKRKLYLSILRPLKITVSINNRS
jgi:hypothetical protein